MSYSGFAAVYDRLMEDAQYTERADYLIGLFRRFGKMPTLLLDAGCGTGELSVRLAQAGMDVIGADASFEMLSVAREKAEAKGLDLLFLCQSLEELDLYGTVDGCVCTLDVLNHLPNRRTLQRALSRISLFLEPGALFLFDVNTVYKHRHVLGNNTFAAETENLFYTWQNHYLPQGDRVQIDLDFFLRREEGTYERLCESFCERTYPAAAWKQMAEQAGFTVLACYDDLTDRPPHPHSQRVVYVCRKCK